MAKKEKKPKKPAQVWKLYEVKGEAVERKNSTCPKCGDGYFMAKHGNRLTCGKCYYTEFTGTKEAKQEAPKEQPKEEQKQPPKAEKPAEEAPKEQPKAEKPAE
ncbi:30S ribosomal protein S27ae [Candidatus Woesearchaeota archaeon]|nr:30S ribosomal protein S27ae [Candidatus Woesearchaeota archaeon]